MQKVSLLRTSHCRSVLCILVPLYERQANRTDECMGQGSLKLSICVPQCLLLKYGKVQMEARCYSMAWARWQESLRSFHIVSSLILGLNSNCDLGLIIIVSLAYLTHTLCQECQMLLFPSQ